MRDVKSGELLLREVVKRWREYKFIVRWVSSFFMYLDQFFTRIGHDCRMRNAALLILHNQVYEELKGQIINTVFSMIDADRDGNSVDRALVKEVLEIVYDLQSETLSAAYKTDFELALLESSGAYYLIKTDNWYQNLPYPEYMSKVVECLNAENFRAMQYLHPSTVQKLLEVYEEIQGQIISTILSMIDADRDGNSVDRALVKEVLEIVYDLQSETLSEAYQTDFELALLDSSGAYYLIKMAYWHQNLPYPEYMSKVVECVTAENFRAMQYLHPSTVQKLLERIKSIHSKLNRIDGNNLANKEQQLKL